MHQSARSAQEIKIGERLQVVSIARVLVDRDTQTVLGTVEQAGGEIKNIAIKIAIAWQPSAVHSYLNGATFFGISKSVASRLTRRVAN